MKWHDLPFADPKSYDNSFLETRKPSLPNFPHEHSPGTSHIRLHVYGEGEMCKTASPDCWLTGNSSPLSSVTTWRAHGIALILQMRKVRPRLVKSLTKGHTGDDDLSPRMVRLFLSSCFSRDRWTCPRQMQGQEAPEKWRPWQRASRKSTYT